MDADEVVEHEIERQCPMEPLGLHVADLAIMVRGARPPGVNQELGHGVDADADHARDRAHRTPLDQHGKDLDALREGQLVHAPHNMNFLK